MAIAGQQIRPIVHLPLVLGVLRRLEVAAVIDRLMTPHPAHVLSAHRLDGGHHTQRGRSGISEALSEEVVAIASDGFRLCLSFILALGWLRIGEGGVTWPTLNAQVVS
jgi:hypothetical protein